MQYARISRRERKKRNTLKKKGMTSHARWWHMARAAGSVDGVRIIVTLAAEGKGERRIVRAVPPRLWTTLLRGKGVQAGGRRPEVSASEQTGSQAGKKSARVARVVRRDYARGGGGGRVQPACSCLLAAAPFLPYPSLSPARCRAPSCPYVRSPRAPQAHASRHRRSRYPPPLWFGRAQPLFCLLRSGERGAGGTTIISRGASSLATSSRGLHFVMSTRARDYSLLNPTHAHTRKARE